MVWYVEDVTARSGAVLMCLSVPILILFFRSHSLCHSSPNICFPRCYKHYKIQSLQSSSTPWYGSQYMNCFVVFSYVTQRATLTYLVGKIPIGLVTESKAEPKVKILDTESYDTVFGPKKQRKRPRLQQTEVWRWLEVG